MRIDPMDARMPDSPYSINEAATLSGLSRATITRLFESEPGVFVLERPEQLHKRKHRTIRIPRPVFDRVIRRLTNR
jgi:AraC-like DNA-binding protein